MDEKLTGLVRKCEELYDMTNKHYSDNVWEEKFVGTNRWRVEKNTANSNAFLWRIL